MSEPGSEGYAASKGGIYSLTHALALSLAEWHITVNSISPGWIQTHDYEQLRAEDHSQHPLRMMVAARIPIKDFFMFISLSLLCWTDCFIKGLFPINHLFGHASVNGDVFAIDEVVLVLT